MELPAMALNHDGPSERLPAPRVKAAIERWNYRMDVQEMVGHHTTDTNTALQPVDRVMALLYAGSN